MTVATADTPHTAPVALGKPRSKRLRKIRETGVMSLLVFCGLFSAGTTFAIIWVLAAEAIHFFTTAFQMPDGTTVQVTPQEFLTDGQWNPLLGAQKHYGIWPLIVGTLQVTVVAMALALPLGLITAIWLSEYAPAKIRAVLKPVLEVLAGIPTVVFGFFALTVITPGLRLEWWRSANGDPVNPLDVQTYNALGAGIAVGIMCLPIVCSLAEDALRAVPKSLREGAYGLGGTKFDVSVRVVFPAALSGIVAAFLLAIARAVGETMIVALAAGASPVLLSENLLSMFEINHETQTMTGYMVQIFLGDVGHFGPEYASSYAVAATLFVMTLILTVMGHQIRKRFRQVYE